MAPSCIHISEITLLVQLSSPLGSHSPLARFLCLPPRSPLAADHLGRPAQGRDVHWDRGPGGIRARGALHGAGQGGGAAQRVCLARPRGLRQPQR